MPPRTQLICKRDQESEGMFRITSLLMGALLIGALLVLAAPVSYGASSPLLLQNPTVSKTQIAFVYGGDLWTVARDGGEATRLTTSAGIETNPCFSPDGSLIAFTGQYDGNTDVYVIPSAGGVPKRLTYHPAPDVTLGWTPDGKNILFRSAMHSYSRFNRLFTVPVEGGPPAELPLPMGEEASFSPDGSRLAYLPLATAFDIWKHYRGGRTTAIWIARLSDSSIEKLPRENSNDFNPMWVGNRVYFLSDRDGAVTLYYYDTGAKRVSQALPGGALDIKSASAGPGAIVYDQFGSIHLFDLNSGKEHAVSISVAGDLPEVRRHFENVASQVHAYGISPTGVRAVFEAHGEILTVPADKGDMRNLTNTPGAAERDPAWSPDGKSIAYFSDESGEYALHVSVQTGTGAVRKINLGNPPSFYYSPIWSHDSKKIAYTDKRLNLWYVDLDKGSPVKVDTNRYENPYHVMDPDWSPDSRWIVYTRQLRNRLAAVFVYSLESGKTSQVTDGLSDARYPVFDKGGKYIYFTASTDAGPASGWLDMSSFPHSGTRSIYLVVLAKDQASPLAPESDEEKPAADEKDKAGDKASPDKKDQAPAGEKPASPDKPGAGAPGKPGGPKPPEPVKIDFENISQRILALPLPARPYQSLQAGKAGEFFIIAAGGGPSGDGAGQLSVQKFDMKSRKAEDFVAGISAFVVSSNGEKALYRQGARWTIAPVAQPPKPTQAALKTESMEVEVDPRAEWGQMYNEVWRIERDFFYDPGLHGVNLADAQHKYEPYLAGLASRADLNYLFAEMLGTLSVGHTFVAGGAIPEPRQIRGGLLGADYSVENGRYKFARVYSGENWNPRLRAPLTEPGVNVAAGEYLLAVNGRDLRAGDDLYSFFEETAGKQVTLRVGTDPTGAGARTVTVVPVDNEIALRNRDWIEGNRRKIDQLSGGRLAYVYLPDTGGGGFTNFNRYYFAQLDKEGAVIDERFNGGGAAADYIIDYMRRPLMNYWFTREGEPFTTPTGSIFGPKAMIINEYAGSGGDALPWYFHHAGVGTLVGKRTWGGLVGIYDYPVLMDGGFVTAPRVAFWNPNGTWDVENHGVAPDIEVEYDPKLVREGHDPQLERAVQVVMDAMKKTPPSPRHPPFPNYYNNEHPQPAGGPSVRRQK